MLSSRVIPCLLKKGTALVKTTKFKEINYIGDAINTVQIFNNFEVDELVILDITASIEAREPDYEFIKNVADECFMPLTYGGGVRNIEVMKKIFNLGTEKIVLCSHVPEEESLIQNASKVFGSQSIIVSIDVKKNIWGKQEVYTYSGTRNTKRGPIEYAQHMEQLGAGEILLNSIDRDGTMEGFDTTLIKKVSSSINIPLIACGGAGSKQDLQHALRAGASAVAAGSLFVYQGTNRSVLINFPSPSELTDIITTCDAQNTTRPD